MSAYNHSGTDIKTLIGDQPYHQGYVPDTEALEAHESEPLTCYFCRLEITPDQTINLHHPTYKSNGGTHVEPAHERCHVEYHSRQGDFKKWGERSAETRAWSWNLKNVRTNPAYEFDRQYYLALYAH